MNITGGFASPTLRHEREASPDSHNTCVFVIGYFDEGAERKAEWRVSKRTRRRTFSLEMDQMSDV